MKTTCKTEKNFLSFLINYVKNSDKLSIRENYIILFEFLANYLTSYENDNGYIGLPFLTVAPEPFIRTDINFNKDKENRF